MKNKRKSDHLRICVEEKIESGNTGFDKIQMTHMALPEIDFDKIDMKIKFLGKLLNYPLIIEGMTGGTKESLRINRDLAEIAREFGIGFGVGSERPAIDAAKPAIGATKQGMNREIKKTDEIKNNAIADTYRVRDVAPDIFLIANLGAVQLNYGYGIDECEKAIELIDADALALHLNPLHEVIQPEGNKNFSNLIPKINNIAKELKKPVIIKCVGSGISYEIAKQLRVSAIDVGGVGGTSWSLVESHRGDKKTKITGERFSGWGISTADAISELFWLKLPLVGSGGIRTGLDCAKAIALGADCVGIALPILKAWKSKGNEGVREFINQFLTELRIAMFLTGSENLSELKGKIRKTK